MQLQFVSGLGPRKAQALLRAAAREEGVASRYVLWNELRVLGRCVFRQAMSPLNPLALPPYDYMAALHEVPLRPFSLHWPGLP